MQKNIKFKLNNKSVSITVDDERMLLWVLRTDLGLIGTKYGCGEGFCGACTALVNNKAVRSCQLPVKKVQGKEVVTIEGLSQNKKLHPIQEAFMKHDALQCGYCTPGMILAAKSLLDKEAKPSDVRIRLALDGHVCRCTGYAKIVQAIEEVARNRGGHEDG